MGQNATDTFDLGVTLTENTDSPLQTPTGLHVIVSGSINICLAMLLLQHTLI